MKQTRKSVPKATKDLVLREFNHRCAICGIDKPQIHHIDEDPGNNSPENLLPLCPNCHLLDQHDPTSTVDQRKLSLFRKFKDPLILSAQFEPLFKRMRFLMQLTEVAFDLNEATSKAKELVEFILRLEMGAFYGPKIQELVNYISPVRIYGTNTPDDAYEKLDEESRKDHFEKLRISSSQVLELAVELLRYQRWESPSHTRDGRPRRSVSQ